MSDMLIVFGLLVGGIGGLIIASLLCFNHLTKIIEIIIGAAHYYFVYHAHADVGADFIGGLIMGLSVLDLFAAFLVISELCCLIGFVMNGVGYDSKPSPSSHAIGGLVNLIMSFFR